jgi:hypothetical protein
MPKLSSTIQIAAVIRGLAKNTLVNRGSNLSLAGSVFEE